MILNNCTTCGRKQKIGRTSFGGCNAWCACGKMVHSNGDQWIETVAADMWNRANPQKDYFEFRPDHINKIAHDLAISGFRTDVSQGILNLTLTQISVFSADLVISRARLGEKSGRDKRSQCTN